jgi:hypothetical protein
VVYRKGELSPAAVDRGWPHQVALPASACEDGGYKTIHDFCKDLSLCRRGGHCVRHDEQWFNVYCFAEAADAEKFMARFGGERFDPRQRGKGSNWMRWKRLDCRQAERSARRTTSSATAIAGADE